MISKSQSKIISNQNAIISFEQATGKLIGIKNLITGNEYLNDEVESGSPFAVYYDFKKDYEITRDEHGVFSIGDNPAEISNKVFSPFVPNCKIDFCASEDTDSSELKIIYFDKDSLLQAELAIRLKEDRSTWSLKLTNSGESPRKIIGVFPFFSGLKLADGQHNLMAVNDQAGYVLPLWSSKGGIYGNSLQMSMQWGCVFDDITKDAFGFIIKDQRLINKEISYRKPNLEVRYFPIQAIGPGETISFPDVEIMIYSGDWKKTAVMYRDWCSRAFEPAAHSEFLPRMDGYLGQWFHKRGQDDPLNRTDDTRSLMNSMESFKELPDVYRRLAVDNIEFAFHCRGSMGKSRSGMKFIHTDGDNVLREDLGGASALKQGINLVHQLGYHFTFYIEGYICPDDCDLVVKGHAKDWCVMNKDGSNLGPYSEKNWLHMCPGSEGWQNHLAETAARLVRETGADGIRLDSLGCYFFPCYNPKHNHKSPFDFNQWMSELLGKVVKAVRQVNPNCVLLTEGSPDFYGQYFDGALTQQWSEAQIAVSRDVSLMRVAVPDFFVIVHNTCGPVAASLMGYPGGCGGNAPGGYFSELDQKWRSVRFAVKDIIRWGNAAHDNPKGSRDDVFCRRFSDSFTDVIIGARPFFEKLLPGKNPNPDIGLKKDFVSFQVRMKALERVPVKAYLYDIEKMSTEEIEFSKINDEIVFSISSNWFMIILSDKPLPLATIDIPETLTSGKTFEVKLSLSETNHKLCKGILSITRLEIADAGKTELAVNVPGTIKVAIPEILPSGIYPIELCGDQFWGCKRFIKVKHRK